MAKKMTEEQKLKSKLYKLESEFKPKLKKAKQAIVKREKAKGTREADRKRKTKEKVMIAKQKKDVSNLTRQIEGKKLLKKDKVILKKDTLSSIKKDAQSIFQLWSRLKLSLSYGMTPVMDKPLTLHPYDKVVGGHYYPKSLYPHIMYYEDNCFAQTSGDNKKLGQNVAYHCSNEVKETIGAVRFLKLNKLAEDQEEKNKIRKKDFHIDATRKYGKKIIKLEEERGVKYMSEKLRKRYKEFKL